MRYRCMMCGWIYDENNEDMKFNDLPTDWVCPECGADKSQFVKINE